VEEFDVYGLDLPMPQWICEVIVGFTLNYFAYMEFQYYKPRIDCSSDCLIELTDLHTKLAIDK
jgi:hypothetical protein